MNCVLIILDSWRQDHCGCYGNKWIHTPNLDALAAESVVFTRAYPESLPTLPVRRALHTGRRVYPYWNHVNYKGDFAGAAGWGPVDESLTTVAELLHDHGYRTGFITDAYHQFKPSKNFHRGFDEWHFIRGQEHDKYRSGPAISDAQVARHLSRKIQASPESYAWYIRSHRQYLMNVADRQSEEDYFPAQVFRQSADWLHRNQDAEQFFLTIDSFDPHEPWDPPAYYRKLYDAADDNVAEVIWGTYGSGAEERYSPRELQRMRANYAGEVTMVDRWLGHFMEALRISGRLEDTVVGVISDHGHNLGDWNLTGKQGHPLTRAVADLIMMVRYPDGLGAGARCDALCYNFDLTTTLLRLMGATLPEQMQGLDLTPVVQGKKPGRGHITSAWGPEATYIDDHWWCNASILGANPLLFDLKRDPQLTQNVAEQHPEIVQKAVEMFLHDAGGEYPDGLVNSAPIPGCTPLLGEA